MGLNADVSDLIDTTEMYLRTVFELQEEGVVPMRARIAERLGQSGPTVSQTVARMERDGLLTVEGDRHLELTQRGQEYAARVMRKHRVAECLLVDVIGVPLEEVHTEACRWEHVMSDAVEARVLALLDGPTHSPFGNPIPALAELLPDAESSGLVDSSGASGAWVRLADVGGPEVTRVTVRRIGESAHADPEVVGRLRRAGVVPGGTVQVQSGAEGLLVGSAGEYIELPLDVASHIAVEPLG